ncbi:MULTISPECIES: FKBP-type peptidyl-prolyl cis-trans isomerase [Schaalia]|uniref:FKBP-type peptidyl-prolyl cis-trans isomerase n=1 Tax=Schaalia TaxID=2529408 RepID=UPI0026ED2037|nr:peptidylprolyl isomerase [Schaalia hyovaginalis]MCI6557273.1 peptidylprolyl isomerase [Schaalia hyovaginalis]MCI7512469.1 peptidylprolyl isomerase [Schaalia hyovaginalis]MDD7554866.1 peptidylprolyl isomerase [Schaalia hyovaginalis]MDY3094554.1 peptidylprolyl isomerase [Schaalia hyovaginalis]MDY4492890.1 peptidylprolyl isomerase [Schaalia hyovaginalis]
MNEPRLPQSFPSRRTAQPPRPRRRFGPLAALLVLAVALAAVVGVWRLLPSRNGAEGTLQELIGPFDRISVSGRVGATPVVDFSGPVRTSAVKVRELIAGDGREIEQGGPVLLSISAFDATTGENLAESARPDLFVGRATPEELGSDLASLVIGRKEGARLLAIHPVSQESGRATSEVVVVDVLWSTAKGAEDTVNEFGAVSVAMSPTGPIVSHDEKAPDGLTVQSLIVGDGPQVGVDDSVVAQYQVVGWTDGAVRSSTWRTGMPEVIALPEAMKGLVQGVTDRRVGSRLAITIPADFASGDDTLIVVIDILGTEPRSSSDLESAPGEAAQSK